MDIKQIFKPADQSKYASLALLLLRLIAGTAFLFHGYNKIINPFGWMGAESPVPGVFQALAAVSEFGGGIAWILGLMTVLASMGVASTMAVAVYMQIAIFGNPFVSVSGGSYELALVYFALALVFVTVGPGSFSLDRKIFG